MTTPMPLPLPVFTRTRTNPIAWGTAWCLFALALAIGSRSATAQTSSTWTNTSSASAGWQSSGNWNNGVPSGAGAAASIIADITAPQTITLDGAVTLGSLTIGDPTAAGASSYTINAGTYTSGSSTLPGTLTFDVSSGGASLSQTTTSAANLITTNVVLADPLTISNSATSTALTLSGTISGTGGITKTGTGALVLSGQSTFTGGVNLSAGSIRVGNNAAFGTGTATIGNATVLMANSTASRTLANALSLSGSFTLGDATNTGALNLTGAATLTGSTQITNASYVSMSGAIGDGGNARSLTKAGAGTLVLGGTNSYTGGTTISAGTLEITANERLANAGNVTMTSGTLDLGGFTETVNAFSATAAATVTAGALNATGGYSFTNGSSTTVTINAALGGGSAALTKSGAGTVLLTGANTFSGGANITGGVVQVGSNTALGSGTISLAGATLQSDSATARTLANSLTIGGAVTLGGSPAGILTFSNASPVSLSANTTLTNATGVTFSGGLSGTGSHTFTKLGNGTLTLNGPSSVAGGVSLNAGGLTVGSGGSLSGDVTVNAGVTLTNAVANGITGNVTVNNNGTFTVSSPTTIGALTVTGTGGTIGGNGGLTASSISANITAGGATTFSATLAGSGGFTKTGAGTAVMSGANSGYTGQVTLSEGLMQFNSVNAFGTGTLSLVSGTLSANSTTARALGNAVVSFDGDVTIGDATNTGIPTFSGSGVLTGNRTLTFASNATLTGGLSGSGFGFTKEGSGELTLNGANTYSGTTNVNAGVLILGAASAGKTGETNVNGGTLRLANDNALGGASGDSLVLTSGAITSNSSGARAIANQVTLAGNVTVGAGSTNTGAITFAGPVTLTGNRTLSTAVATTISGSIGDGGNGYRLTKTGGSTLVVSGTNTHSGGFVVSNGQLTVSSSSALGSGNVSINGGTLVATGANSNVMNWLNSGRIAANPNGGIAITANSSEAIDFSAYENLSLGASAGATYSGSFTPYETNGTKIYRLGGGAGTLTFNPVIADGTNPTQVWIRGDTSGGIVRLGSSNTYSGGLYLDSGTLDVNADNQLGNITGSGSNAIVFTGGTLRYTTVTTDFSGKFAMPTANNQVAINTNSLNVSFATTITGSGGLSKSGNGTLNAIAGYSGATNVSGGTLALTLSSTAAAPPAGTFTSTGGTLDLITSVDRTVTARISQRTTGQVRLSPDAGTTLTLSGTLDRQTTTGGAPGAITVASGLVRFDGTVTSVADTDWTVSGGTLELANALADQNDTIVSVAAGGTVKLGASDQILTSVSGLSGTLDLNGYSETLTSLAGSGTVTNTTTTQVSTLSLSAASTVAARLTDSGAGAGTLALVINPTSASTIFSISNPANDYRGGTTMQTGVMALGADNVLGSGGLTMNGGTLRSSSTDPRTYAGSLVVNAGVTLGDATNNGALTLSGPITISGSTRQLTVSSNVTISGTIGDGGNGYGLTKAGTGLLILSGTSTYTGLTTLNGGTTRLLGGNTTSGTTTLTSGVMQLGRDNPLAAGPVNLNGGTLTSDGATARTLNNTVTFGGNVTLGDATNTGALTLAGTGSGSAVRTLTVASDVGLTGQLIGALGITKDGSGVLTISNASNTYTGGTRINAGRVRVGSNSALGGAAGTVTLSAGSLSSDGSASRSLANAFSVVGDFTLGNATDNGALTLTGNTLLTGNRTITFASDVTLTGVLGEQGAGRVLTKDGAGTFTLANAVSYTGGTVLNAGRIRVGVESAFGTATTTLNGGALSSDGQTERTIANPISYGGNVTLGNATDTGGLTFTGTQTLTGNRTITVASNVTMSSRIADGGNTFGFSKSGAATLTLTGTSTFSGPLNVDQGTVFVASGGVLASSGTVEVNSGGILAGSGTVGTIAINAAGTVSPGNSPGTITAANGVFEPGGNYNWQLLNASGTAGAALGWDLIALSGTGTLDLTGLSAANRFNLNTWTLSSINPDVDGPALNFRIDDTSFYRFQLVSFADLSKLLLPAGMAPATADQDLTSLFAINTAALNGTAGWDTSQAPSVGLMSIRVGLDGESIDLIIVPEPGTWMLAALGAACVGWAARRKRSRRLSSRPRGAVSDGPPAVLP